MEQHDIPDWAHIVELHAHRVFRVAMRILGSVQDAEDVAQDVFAEAFRMHRSGTIQSWTGVLVRLATLRSVDRLRQRRPMQELHDGDRVSFTEPFENIAAAELAAWLRSAIAELPEQQATVFTMIHFEQLSREDVAASLRISPEAVSSALYKARQRLQNRMAVYENKGKSR